MTKEPKKGIHIKGARVHNLKNIEVFIPHNQLVVVTGVSGSGKSSLMIDTLFAEGQRRYVESLSAYARQFLGRMKKPEVDFIHGICPAIAIEQKTSNSNARSTVGTLTEIDDFLRMLYARIGKMIHPDTGEQVIRHTVTDVVNYIQGLPAGARTYICTPIQDNYPDRLVRTELELLLQKGYTRLLVDQNLTEVEELLKGPKKLLSTSVAAWRIKANVQLLIDRFVVQTEDADFTKRLADSVQTAFVEGGGNCHVAVEGKPWKIFSTRFELDGMEFPEITPQLFNFNNSFGACPVCEGYGRIVGIDEDKVIPERHLSVYEGAVAPWRTEGGGAWLKEVIKHANKVDFPVHRPYEDLTKAELKMLWQGTNYFEGIRDYFQQIEEKAYKIQNRVLLARYRGKTNCTACDGSRLRKEASWIKVGGVPLTDLMPLPVKQLVKHFEKLKLSEHEHQVAKRLLTEITSRLQTMHQIGLGYLSLNRLSNSLSGGEVQRINLTRTLGSNLTSSLYILDEPSVGLHARDTAMLVEVLQRLRDMGNTVVVVEHEELIMQSADYLIDIGPGAGIHGGNVMYAGSAKDLAKSKNDSLTAAYLTGKRSIVIPGKRPCTHWLKYQGARLHNLHNVDISIPLQALSVVSGVSGSGKTTLIHKIILPALQQWTSLYASQSEHGPKRTLTPPPGLGGDLHLIHAIEYVSQHPIGRSSRSNPVTYIKAYDYIRDCMAAQPQSVMRGFKPRHFSFNVEGGRCESCKGEGEQVVDMQFLADVRLECEECRGRRFMPEVLEVTYHGKNIADILDLTVIEAIALFEKEPEITRLLNTLFDVGLGYVHLGQSSSSLSGGEAQRVKLASFLAREGKGESIFFIFDEPTTGLHMEDVATLLKALQALVDRGHTVCVIEHNLDVIRAADWLNDLGPGGGDEGGHLVFAGRPEDSVRCKESWTGKYLKKKI